MFVAVAGQFDVLAGGQQLSSHMATNHERATFSIFNVATGMDHPNAQIVSRTDGRA